MAKKSSTIHVEEFVWKEIERVQNEYGISSRNTAIEYLIAEYKSLKGQSGKVETVAAPEEVKQEVKVEEVKPNVKDAFDNALDNLEDGMPD